MTLMLYFRVSHGQLILDQLILNLKLFNRSAKTNTIFDCNVSYRYHQCENMLTNGWHSHAEILSNQYRIAYTKFTEALNEEVFVLRQ